MAGIRTATDWRTEICDSKGLASKEKLKNKLQICQTSEIKQKAFMYVPHFSITKHKLTHLGSMNYLAI